MKSLRDSPPKLNRDEGCRAHQRIVHPESLAHFCEHFCASHRCARASHACYYRRRHGEPNIAARLEGGMALHRHRVPRSHRRLGVSGPQKSFRDSVINYVQLPVLDRTITTRPPYRGYPFNALDLGRAKFYTGISGTTNERGRSLCAIQVSGPWRRRYGGANDRRAVTRKPC